MSFRLKGEIFFDNAFTLCRANMHGADASRIRFFAIAQEIVSPDGRNDMGVNI